MTTTTTAAPDRDLRDFYQDALMRRANDFAPDPDNKVQVYRLARHLYTGWIITKDDIVKRRWSDYTPEKKQELREIARELALEAKAIREAALVAQV